MVMVPVVVVAVRTVFIFIILLNLFSSVYAEDIFVFSEIGSGIKIENQFEEEIDSDFFTTFFYRSSNSVFAIQLCRRDFFDYNS